MSNGIDISQYNGKMDLSGKIQTNNQFVPIDFVYIKALEGIHSIDPLVYEHRDECVRNNIPYGFYHFFVPSEDPISQAQAFRHLLLTSLSGYSLIPTVDVETNPTLLAPIQIEHAIQVYSNQFNTKPILYSYLDFLNANLLTDHLLSNKLWLANYSGKEILPNGWDKCDIWQYTDKGTISTSLLSSFDIDICDITKIIIH